MSKVIFGHTQIRKPQIAGMSLMFDKSSDFVSYRKCPKIFDTKDYDKMAYANSADPDQTDQGLHCLLFH